MMAGMSTLWPRLETGHISETPWTRPTDPQSQSWALPILGRLGRGHVEVAGPGPADDGRDEHVVAQAGDREHLRDTLDEADDGRLQVGQVGHSRPFTEDR